MNSKPAFRVRFNEHQYVDVYVALDARRFRRVNDCHAYYMPAEGRRQRRGLFGYIYLSELNYSAYALELVAHEIQHLFFDWVLCRRGARFGIHNEERIATLTGEFTRRFWKQCERWQNAKK